MNNVKYLVAKNIAKSEKQIVNIPSAIQPDTQF